MDTTENGPRTPLRLLLRATRQVRSVHLRRTRRLLGSGTSPRGQDGVRKLAHDAVRILMYAIFKQLP